jgi:hypothetical protein
MFQLKFVDPFEACRCTKVSYKIIVYLSPLSISPIYCVYIDIVAYALKLFSMKYITLNLRITKILTCLLLTPSLLGFLSFLTNISEFLPHYKESHFRR